MARDYKPAASAPKSAGKGSPFIAGFLLGLILGIGVSVAVAIMIKGGDSPFVERAEPAPAPSISSSAPAEQPAPPAQPEPQATANRFDFYKILPGTESPATEQEFQQSQAAQQADQAAPQSENYFLQVGAFQTEQEADNIKAKLALLGMEAVIQTANLDDKGVWHRVRVGPFTDIDQISKYRAELTRNGFNADLIKIHSNTPDQ